MIISSRGLESLTEGNHFIARSFSFPEHSSFFGVWSRLNDAAGDPRPGVSSFEALVVVALAEIVLLRVDDHSAADHLPRVLRHQGDFLVEDVDAREPVSVRFDITEVAGMPDGILRRAVVLLQRKRSRSDGRLPPTRLHVLTFAGLKWDPAPLQLSEMFPFWWMWNPCSPGVKPKTVPVTSTGPMESAWWKKMSPPTATSSLAVNWRSNINPLLRLGDPGNKTWISVKNYPKKVRAHSHTARVIIHYSTRLFKHNARMLHSPTIRINIATYRHFYYYYTFYAAAHSNTQNRSVAHGVGLPLLP